MDGNDSDKKRGIFCKSGEYYLHLLENSKDIFYMMNAETGKFEYISPASTKISGFTAEEVMKMGMEGINKRVHPDDLRKVKNKIMDVLMKKIIPKDFNGYIEQRFRHKAGHWIWFGINRNFLADADGRIKIVVGNIRDITEIKLLQQKLESSLNHYESLYNNAQVALFRTRISDGKMLECNEILAKLLGYENRKKCLAEYSTLKYYTNLKRREELIAILNEKGWVDNFELKFQRMNGQDCWIKISAKLFREEGYMEGAVWDITVSKILTKTENEVLGLVMQGKSNREIAAHLKRSIRTVEDHRANIMYKLDARNLVELTRKVINFEIADEKNQKIPV